MCVFTPLDSRLILKWNSFCSKEKKKHAFHFVLALKKMKENKWQWLDILWHDCTVWYFMEFIDIPKYSKTLFLYSSFGIIPLQEHRAQEHRMTLCNKMRCKRKYARPIVSWSFCSTSVSGRKRLYFCSYWVHGL